MEMAIAVKQITCVNFMLACPQLTRASGPAAPTAACWAASDRAEHPKASLCRCVRSDVFQWLCGIKTRDYQICTSPAEVREHAREFVGAGRSSIAIANREEAATWAGQNLISTQHRLSQDLCPTALRGDASGIARAGSHWAGGSLGRPSTAEQCDDAGRRGHR